MPKPNTEGLFTAAQAAEYIGVSYTTIYKWIRTGVIVPDRIGRKPVFKPKYLADFRAAYYATDTLPGFKPEA